MECDQVPLYSEATQAKDTIPMMTPITSPPEIKMVKPLVGPRNTVTECPYCHATVKTTIKHTVTNRTHWTAFLCCSICCCCCLPYCMDSTRNIDHYCPLCDKFLGTYEK